MYYLQSRYYDPELGRFINADAFASTGQGILGNNMFAYCNNNPTNSWDPTGTCQNTFSIYFKVDCGSKDCPTSYEYKPSLCLVSSNGLYGSVNVGIFNITGAILLAVDTKGNMQLQGSVGFDVTSAGTFAASAGMINSWYIDPDISSLLGDAYSLGASKTIKDSNIPVALTKGIDFVRTGDGYWGISHASGVAGLLNLDIDIKDLLGYEVHCGYSYGTALTPAINVFEIIGSFFCRVVFGRKRDMKTLFDLHWIYDTSFTIEMCMELLSKLSPINSYVGSRVYCSKISETQMEIKLKQPESSGKIYCNKYIADFYRIENAQTAIVLRFSSGLFSFVPCIPIDEVDALFAGLICAQRRK